MFKTVIIIAVVILAAVAGGAYVWPASQAPMTRHPRPQRARHSEWVIEGRAINAGGESVAGAKVFAELDSAMSSRVAYSFTDKDGSFKIEVEGTGDYKVYGSKESEGYPLTISGFHQESISQIPKVSLSQNQVARDVVVQLGEKVGVVEGVISDATTHKRISKATITLRRADNPDLYYIIGDGEEKENGKFKVLVPAAPFTIEVAAPGYETWTYGMSGHNGRSEPLTVSRGEHKKLDIAVGAKRSSQ